MLESVIERTVDVSIVLLSTCAAAPAWLVQPVAATATAASASAAPNRRGDFTDAKLPAQPGLVSRGGCFWFATDHPVRLAVATAVAAGMESPTTAANRSAAQARRALSRRGGEPMRPVRDGAGTSTVRAAGLATAPL